MTRPTVRNLPALIRSRLLDHAREHNEEFQLMHSSTLRGFFGTCASLPWMSPTAFPLIRKSRSERSESRTNMMASGSR